MSALRRSGQVGQRIHRERQQPEARRHLGELEKKKDYRLRANDYQEKKQQLKVLHKKALDRNPDEFYFHMVNSQTKDGIHHEKTPEPEEDTKVQRMLIEHQDLRYVQYKRDMERKKIDKSKASLQMILDLPTASRSKHTVFVETKKEAKQFDPIKYFNTHPSLVDRTYNRPKMSTLREKSVVGVESKTDVILADRDRRAGYSELLKRMERERELSIVVDKLQLKKNLSVSAKSGGQKPKRLTKGSNRHAAIYRWTYERKR